LRLLDFEEVLYWKHGELSRYREAVFTPNDLIKTLLRFVVITDGKKEVFSLEWSESFFLIFDLNF